MTNFQNFIMALLFIIVSILFFLSSPCHSQSSEPWWTTTGDDDLGILCQTDNDSIGQHLGCTCNSSVRTGMLLTAHCANNMIGYNNSLSLPPKVNISGGVRILDLSYNHLTSLTPETFGACEAVENLIMSDNELRTFTGVNCPRLMKLNLSHNRLKNLSASALAFTPRLIELDLTFNELVTVDPNSFEQLQHLRILKLGSNQIGMELFYQEEYVLSLKNMKSLEELDLSNSSLPDFPLYLINGTSHLRRLNLRDNIIQFIGSGVFELLAELTALDLSGNDLEEIEPSQFYGLKNLRFLALDKMRKLTAIREHAFSGLTHLYELSCQMNFYLVSIDSLAFRGDPDPLYSTSEEEAHLLDSHPKIVRLGDNDLHLIDYPLLQWSSLEILELHRNSFMCDCSLQWASDFYRHKPHEAAILNDSYFVCYEPHIFAGVPVVAVNPEEMLCFSPAATVAGTIGIVIFGILLFSFCTVVILNQMGMLPDWVRQYNIFGSGSNLPTYTRVNPRPNTKANKRMVERVEAIPDVHCYSSTTEPIPSANNNNAIPVISGADGKVLRNGLLSGGGEPVVDELEWDNADIGRP